MKKIKMVVEKTRFQMGIGYRILEVEGLIDWIDRDGDSRILEEGDCLLKAEWDNIIRKLEKEQDKTWCGIEIVKF